MYIYYTTHKVSSANIPFGSANIQQYYTDQKLIAQLSLALGETMRQKNCEKIFLSLFICAIVV